MTVGEQGTLWPAGEEPPPGAPVFPAWFRVGKNTPRCHREAVASGQHPLGLPLSDVPGALCGNCGAWCELGGAGRDYPKCLRMIREGTVTHGPATDLRARWRGCALWSEAPPGMKVPRRRPSAKRRASTSAERGGSIPALPTARAPEHGPEHRAEPLRTP